MHKTSASFYLYIEYIIYNSIYIAKFNISVFIKIVIIIIFTFLSHIISLQIKNICYTNNSNNSYYC